MPSSKGVVADDLRRLPEIALQLAPHQQVEFLVRAAHFHVALQRHRIVALRQRIEQLVHRDGNAVAQALGEIVALQHARHGVFASQPDDIFIRIGSSHSLLKRTSVFSGSRILNTCAL
jgi:hypothetical protein